MRKALFTDAERRSLREARLTQPGPAGKVPKDCYYDDGQDRLIRPGDEDWSDSAYRRFWAARRRAGVEESAQPIDPHHLSDAILWYARAVKKVRLWTSLVNRHSGVDVTRRSWRDWRSVEGTSIPYWEWVGYMLADETEHFDASARRAVARDFVKRAGLAKGRTVDEAMRAVVHGWDMAHGKRHGY